MSDERFRRLQRDFEATGSLAGEVASLIRRVRIGDLDIEDLGLAAWVAHEGAEVALSSPDLDPEQVRAREFERANARFEASPGDAVVMTLDPRGSFPSWLGKLGRMRPFAIHRAAAASVQAVLVHNPWRDSTRAAVAAFEAWLAEPSPAREAAACAFLNPPGAPPALPGEPHWLSALLESTSPERSRDRKTRARYVVQSCAHEHPEGDVAIRAAIRDEVASWALGYSDPVRLRVAEPDTRVTPPEGLAQ